MIASQNRPLVATIFALGIAQIISWGSFYYSIAVLGGTVRQDLGISSSMLFGAFTFSLLMSGVVAPTVGRLIDDWGGRRVLCAGSAFGALSLLSMATVQGPITLFIASAACGIAMSVCLYEAAFITLNQVSGERYRTAVTAVTLFGGLASTVFWPLSQLLLESIGWRWAVAFYAGLQIFVCLPLHLLVLPRHHRQSAAGHTRGAMPSAPVNPATPANQLPAHGSHYNHLALAFAIGSFVLAVLSVHIISLLKDAGLSPGEAVLVATLIGPMQVLVRLLEFVFARHVGPVVVGIATFVLMVMATGALYFVEGYSALAFIAAGLYGFSNGSMTIVRGTVPAVLFGRQAYGLLLGRLARPAFVARALAPFAFSAALTIGLMQGDAILLLTGCGVVAGIAYLRAIRHPIGAVA